MVELHVDCCDFIHNLASRTYLNYGGNLSHFRPKDASGNYLRPIIMVGQDESVVSQNITNSKHWVTNTGAAAIQTKSDGQSLMVSAFISCEFGIDVELSETDLKEINEKREGQKYINEEAAIAVLGSIEKKALSKSPLTKYFVLGVNNEGYWNYFHMAVQLEDVHDVISHKYPHCDIVYFLTTRADMLVREKMVLML